MPAGNYNRINVESPGNILTASNYNAEHNNHIDNHNFPGLDDYSTNAAQMRATTDPGTTGSESLATSGAGELERLRYAIQQIKGNLASNWYDPVGLSLSQLATPGNLAIGLEFEGNKGAGSSTTDVQAKLINQGVIINALSFSSADVNPADFDATNVKFGNYSYALGSGNVLAFPGQSANLSKGSISAWYRNLAAGDYIAFNPLLGIELFLDSVNGYQTLKITEANAASESAKNSVSVQGSTGRTGDSTFRNVTAKWRVNDENGASTDLLEMEREGADEGTQLASQDIDINPGRGGIWFFGVKNNEPAWDHSYAANGLPSAHSDAWTSGGVPNGAVSNGVLNIATTSTNFGTYTKTNNIDLTQFTMCAKVKRNDAGSSGLVSGECIFRVQDGAVDRGIALAIHNNRVSLLNVASTFSNSEVALEVFLDTSEYHQYWITSEGAGGANSNVTVKLYIDGQFVGSVTNTLTNTDTNSIAFGDISTSAGENSDSDWEYVKYFDAGAVPPIAASSQGNLDSIALVNDVIDDSTITSLQTTKVSQVFGTLPSYGPTLPLTRIDNRNRSTPFSTSSSSFVDVDSFTYQLAGDGVTEYEVEAMVSAQNTSSTAQIITAIDVDNDMVGSSGSNPYGGTEQEAPAANSLVPMFTKRSMVLKPGLHEVRLVMRTSGGTASITDANKAFHCRIRKEIKLG